MQNIRFHNSTRIDENIKKKRLSQTQYPDSKIVVDINKLLNRVKIEKKNETQKKIVDNNKLLNRVKIEKKNETQRKIIFYSFTILLISLFGTLIALLK